MERSILLILWSFAFSTSLHSESLPLSEYIKQVAQNNFEMQAAKKQAEAAFQRSTESGTILSPTLFADSQILRDAKLPQISLFSYDRIENERYSIGIRKQTTFGLEAKLSYTLLHTNVVNAAIPTTGGATPSTNYFDAQPTLELTQSLWANGFGKATRAYLDLSEAQALSLSFSSRFKVKALTATAEETYWRLTLSKERTAVAKAALDQSEKIHDLSSRRDQNHLGDRTDLLQATAALRVRQLEMQAALDEEQVASRNFNRLRNFSHENVEESLEPVVAEQWLKISAPARKGHREDVQAAEQQQRATAAAATTAIEKDEPTLDLYGSYSLNGRKDFFGPALSDPIAAGRPTYSVGLKFVLPLDRGLISDAKDGWKKEQVAAEMIYRQKLLEEEYDWKDWSRRLEEAKRRVILAQQISSAQKEKLTHERQRLREGRTTTFQVLSFEQDFAQSQLSELAAKADLIHTVTQLKLFGDFP